MNVRSSTPFWLWLICLIGFSIYIVISSQTLPEKVAQHFDASGRANDWSPRGTYMAVYLILGCTTSIVVVALLYSIRFFPPQMLNVPRREYWQQPQNYKQACEIMLRYSYYFSSLLLVWLAALHALIVEANQKSTPELKLSAMMPITSAFMLGSVIWVLALIWTFTRNAPNSATKDA